MPINGASPDKDASASYSVEEPNAFINGQNRHRFLSNSLPNLSYFGLARVPSALIRQIKRRLTRPAHLQTPTDYRHTDNHLRLVIVVVAHCPVNQICF